jgi:hypothetical protein
MLSAPTERQLHWLSWLEAHGGVGELHGSHVVAGEARSGEASAISFLHLCARGLLTGGGDVLRVSRSGRRLLGLSEGAALTDLEAMRERDRLTAATWFAGPASGPAQAYRDRRALLAEIERLESVRHALDALAPPPLESRV